VLVRVGQEVQALPRRLTEPPSRRLLWALLAGGVAGLALLAVSYDGWLGEHDLDIAEWVARDMPAWGEEPARIVSWLGRFWGLAVLCTVAAVLLARARAWLDLAFVVTALLGSQLVVNLLKHAFGRPRPDLDPAVPLPGSPSFPSGHATTAVATLGALAVLLTERLASRRARAAVWGTAAVLAGASGLSRVVLGVHFLSDVVAGWCLGLAWLALCLLVRDSLAAARASPSRPRAPASRSVER
jgi:undecaprenyl-diphosphatase